MDHVKRAHRGAETDIKKFVRAVDGTDLRGPCRERRDEARKNLGNLGDDARKVAREPRGH
jgi:hypothetical protein